MKNALFILGAGMVLASSFGVGGCGKQAAPPPVVQAKPAPTPTPYPDVFAKDLDADKLRARADKAVLSLGKYLDEQDPKLRAKFERMSNKFADRIGVDKDRWREKLEAKQRELQPQIDQLKERLERDGGQARVALSEELSKLQRKHDANDRKLSRLEEIGTDAWKKFKAQLKEDEIREKSPPTDGEDGHEGRNANRKAVTPAPES